MIVNIGQERLNALFIYKPPQHRTRIEFLTSHIKFCQTEVQESWILVHSTYGKYDFSIGRKYSYFLLSILWFLCYELFWIIVQADIGFSAMYDTSLLIYYWTKVKSPFTIPFLRARIKLIRHWVLYQSLKVQLRCISNRSFQKYPAQN